MTSAATLTEFLLARIGEDEAAAREAQGEGYYPHYGPTAADEILEMALNEGCSGEGDDHFRRWMPPRVLAECAAKREVVGYRQQYDAPETAADKVLFPALGVPLDRVLRILASVYADHPDFREEWRP